MRNGRVAVADAIALAVASLMLAVIHPGSTGGYRGGLGYYGR